MINDMCAFVKSIEADPEALVTGLTVRDYLSLRLHVQSCDECYGRVENVRKRYPDDGNDGTILSNMN